MKRNKSTAEFWAALKAVNVFRLIYHPPPVWRETVDENFSLPCSQAGAALEKEE